MERRGRHVDCFRHRLDECPIVPADGEASGRVMPRQSGGPGFVTLGPAFQGSSISSHRSGPEIFPAIDLSSSALRARRSASSAPAPSWIGSARDFDSPRADGLGMGGGPSISASSITLPRPEITGQHIEGVRGAKPASCLDPRGNWLVQEHLRQQRKWSSHSSGGGISDGDGRQQTSQVRAELPISAVGQSARGPSSRSLTPQRRRMQKTGQLRAAFRRHVDRYLVQQQRGQAFGGNICLRVGPAGSCFQRFGLPTTPSRGHRADRPA